MQTPAATRTDRKDCTWTEVIADFEWTRTTENRTASIQDDGEGFFLTITTGQHASAIHAIGQGAPALVADQFDTFDAAATMAAIVLR